MDKQQKAALKKLDELDAGISKLQSLSRSVRAALTGEGNIIKNVLTAFEKVWLTRYPKQKKYSWGNKGGQAARDAKKFLNDLGKEELWKRMRAYIASNDPFFVRVKHSWSVFASQINALTNEAPVAGSPAGASIRGCTHDPPCSSNVAHTRRYMAEQLGQ